MTRVSALLKLPVLFIAVAALGAVLAAQAPKTPAAQTPTQVYVAYRAAFDKATKVDDIKPFQSKAVRAPFSSPRAIFAWPRVSRASKKSKARADDRARFASSSACLQSSRL